MTITLSQPLIGEYVITQTYAEHVERAATMSRPYNGGIDYGCPSNTPVYAAAGGRVSKVALDPIGYGVYVMITHPQNYVTVYAHLAMAVTTTNTAVTVGQMIGRSDNTGNSTGPHLHFELRQNGKPIDPAPYFEAVQPDPEQPPQEGYPKLAKVLQGGLRVRTQPDTTDDANIICMGLPAGLIVQVQGIQSVLGNLWADLGGMYAAMTYEGAVLMEWL